MPLQYSIHALQRIRERGLSTDEMEELWNEKRFVLHVMTKDESQYVAFIPQIKEFLLMIKGRDETIITCMPLIWRERTISNTVKYEAYQRAIGTWPVISEKKELPQGEGKIHAKGLIVQGKARKWIKIGAWLKSTPKETLLKNVLEEIKRSPHEIEIITLKTKRGFTEAYKIRELDLDRSLVLLMS